MVSLQVVWSLKWRKTKLRQSRFLIPEIFTAGEKPVVVVKSSSRRKVHVKSQWNFLKEVAAWCSKVACREKNIFILFFVVPNESFRMLYIFVNNWTPLTQPLINWDFSRRLKTFRHYPSKLRRQPPLIFRSRKASYTRVAKHRQQMP